VLFTAPQYFVLLGLTLLFLWRVKNVTFQKVWLVAASYFFYAQWDPRFVLLLAGLSAFTYWCCKGIRRGAEESHRKQWLGAQIIVSLATLAYFKYTNFFLDNLNHIPGFHVGLMSIVLPVGISFIVFEVISYSVDVYRGDTPYEESILDLFLLVAFFPHLVAGPIIKPKTFLPQLKVPAEIKLSNLSAGAQLFLWGLMKKVLVADRVAPFADTVFNHPASFSQLQTWLGVIAYAIQIYGDFSGYTDMAIGSARCMGYDIPRNFNLPYLSQNITDFWRRWHISLSSWLRDYLYIPLGGNRKGPGRQYINLAVVMLLGGLWHGASWNFVLWGGIHGLALAFHKFVMDRKLIPSLPKPFAILSWLTTLVFVIVAWVPFRSTSWETTTTLFQKLALPSAGFVVHYWNMSLLMAIPILVVADIGTTFWHDGRRLHLSRFSHALAFCFCAISVLVLAPPAASPFIYFQF